MMKLSTMQALTNTVNDKCESAVADHILSRWNHDQGTAKYFRASANFQFIFQRAGKRYFLRFNHSIERSIDRIHAEVDFINYLASKGLVIAKPVSSIAGHFVESVSTSQGVFHAVVFEGLAGAQFEEIEELTPQIFMRWGQALGELHQATEGYKAGARPTWKDHLAMISEYLPATEQTAHLALRKLQEQLTRLSINEDNYGLIHFDFELDNIVWNGDKVGIVDFDDSAQYWFVADIAFALRDLFDDSAEKVELQNKSFQNFIAGYRQVKEITQEDLVLIPMFLKLHNLITFAKLHRALEIQEIQGEPVWLEELRKKLTLKMQIYRDGFLHNVQ
jgi:Ser/Thr protein kinase RdoA (MazF antagonist)